MGSSPAATSKERAGVSAGPARAESRRDVQLTHNRRARRGARARRSGDTRRLAPSIAGGTSVAASRRVARIGGIGWALVASACTVGPRYVRPEVPVNAAWSEHGDPRLSAETAVEVAWW